MTYWPWVFLTGIVLMLGGVTEADGQLAWYWFLGLALLFLSLSQRWLKP